MKFKLFLLLSSISVCQINGQIGSGKITISKNVTLDWKIEDFYPENHNIEICKDDFKQDFICKIDGEIWYGSDMGMENPRNRLQKLTLTIESISIELNVANMFNAEVSPSQFLWKKEGMYYKLYGFFSDGAGSYTVHWKILGNTSVREVISNDETHFAWQLRAN